MTSSKFGIEREAIQVTDAKEFPLIAPEKLNQEQRAAFTNAAKLLIDNTPDWKTLDSAVFNAYRIGKLDAEMIRDTLETRSPFTKSINNSLRPADMSETSLFCNILSDRLNSVLGRVDVKVKVDYLADSTGLPWRFLKISHAGAPSTTQTIVPSEWLRFADDYSVSRVTVSEKDSQSVTVGLLNRYRYWTPTQARMLAAEIIWQHGAMLEGNNS